MRHRSATVVAVAFLSLSAAAAAQQPWECPTSVPTSCPDVEDQEELREIPVLAALEGAKELSTTFDVQMRTFCVSNGKKTGTRTRPDGKVVNLYSAQPFKLRTYVYTDPKSGKTFCGFPGPTLSVRKAGADDKGGQGIAILLKNSLPAASEDCANACPSSVPSCNCDDAALKALLTDKCSVPQPAPQECCCLIQCKQEAPNCFHGDNTTNLHFHGSHASPQEPQDFVLLELRPGKAPAPGSHDDHTADHGPYGRIAYGQYQYRVDPFGYTQPEGTHWYHPHKHGSVGQQVANGMAGAMIIRGEFDDHLSKKLGGTEEKLEEKLMVIQQLAPATNLFRQGIARPVLVNGQVSPNITVEPGQVQRWRIVNATMSSGAMLTIKFDPRLVLRQIAMDGVRFSPINSYCQPLANFDPKKPPASFPCDPHVQVTSLTLAPGNRADFLVQMPLLESSANNPPLRIERELVELPGEEGSQRQKLHELDEEIAPGIPEPALFHVDVDDGIEGNDAEPKLLKAGAPTVPERIDLPMPPHLAVVTQANQTVTMTFEQTAAVTGQPWPYSGSPVSVFKIDGKQFNGTCANVTTTVGTTAQWTVSNATQITHPFHIHTNPFLLVDYNGAKLPPTGGARPEPVWMDTMPLPLATLVPCANPANCPGSMPCVLGSPDRCTLKNASMTFLQRYEQFTGEYVLHCHFLGHEDRGMMFSVQTVCSNRYPSSAGKYGVSTRQPDECSGPGPFPNPLPACK
jgi:FtsP/CotA-like multicopper oxidase with cupredoxin domain